MHRDGKIGLAFQLFLHRLDNVVGHEGFAIVFADVATRNKAGFAAQVTRELAAVIVLDDDGALGAAQDVNNGIAMQRDQPAYL